MNKLSKEHEKILSDRIKKTSEFFFMGGMSASTVANSEPTIREKQDGISKEAILDRVFEARKKINEQQKEAAEKFNKPEMINQLLSMVPLLNEVNLHKLLSAAGYEHSKRLQDITFPWKCREHNNKGGE